MRSFLLLARVQAQALANSLAPRAQNGSLGSQVRRIALVALGVVVLLAAGAGYMAITALSLASAGLGDAVPALAVLIGSAASVAFTFMKARGTLFGFADYDHIMSLPVSRRAVVASRLATLFGAAFVTGAVFSAPMLAVYAAVVDASALSVVGSAAVVLLAPAIPTSLAVFAAFAVTAISARFRHANLVYVLLGMVALAAFMVVAYGASFSMGASGDKPDVAAMNALAAGISDQVGTAWPPASLATAAIADGSVPALLAFVLMSLAAPALCLEVLQRSYLTINGMLSARARRNGGNPRALQTRLRRSSSPLAAMTLKEARTVIGIPAYAFNCLFGYLFMVIIAVALAAVGMRDLLASGAIDGVEIDPATFDSLRSMLFTLIPWVFAFAAGMSPSACVALSMEGRCAWLMATAPVPARTVLGSKLLANAVPTVLALAVSTAVLLASGQLDPIGAIQVPVLGAGMFMLTVCAGMAVDVSRPNYAWTTANELVKRSMPIFVAVFGCIALSFAGGAACWLAMSSFGTWAGVAWNLGVGLAGLAVGSAVFWRMSAKRSLYVR